MIVAENEARARARILHDMNDLLKASTGSVWRESPIDQSRVGRDGANPPYVIATGSGRAETAFVAVGIDDGSGYQAADEHGMFLPSEHQPTFPLMEVTDGTCIVFSNGPR